MSYFTKHDSSKEERKIVDDFYQKLNSHNYSKDQQESGIQLSVACENLMNHGAWEAVTERVRFDVVKAALATSATIPRGSYYDFYVSEVKKAQSSSS